MLTKTRKWLLALVVAFAAVFLVACTPKEKEVKLAIPEDITINVDAFVGSPGNYATVVGGDAILLSVSSDTDNADLRVTWTTSDAKKATVNQSGKVTGVSGGTVTITATSLADGNANVKDELTITVYDSVELMDNDIKLLMAAQKEIVGKIPAFIDDAVTLPQSSNNLVTAKYMDLDKNVFANGVYPYDYKGDQLHTIQIELSYKNEKILFNNQLKIVEDVADNDFLAVEEAREAIAEYLSAYSDGGLKIYQSIKFPKLLSELYEWYNKEAPARDVTISWTSTAPGVLTNAGDFTRPNDDTPFIIEPYYTSNLVTGVDRIKVNAKGHTQQEVINAILAPVPAVAQARNVPLATFNAQFNANITWETDKPEVLNTLGKTDPYIENETEVTLKATIKYPGTANASFGFEEVVEVKVLVKPAEKPIQSVTHDLSNRYETEIPSHFAYGVKGRDGENKMPLPTTVGGEGEHKDVVVKWTANEADLFDAEFNLLKQYLRYHRTTLTYSVTMGADTVTTEIDVNVGIAEKENTIYAGGNHYSRKVDHHPIQLYDELQTVSGFDGPMGSASTTYNVNGWTGTTFYRDVEDEETGDITRYQYFSARRYELVLTPEGTYTFDENGILNGGAKTAVDGTAFENRQQTIINLSGKDVKIPLQLTKDPAFFSSNKEAVKYPATNVEKSMAGIANANGGLNLKGYRSGFVTDGQGNIVIGSGAKTIQEVLYEANLALEEPLETLPNYVNLPNGAIAYSKGDVGNATLAAIFAVQGGKIGIESYNVHPTNIIA